MTTEALDDLVLAFSWSMNVLLSGQTPHQDWKGNPLEGGGIDLAFGFRATLCQVRGDWEFLQQLFHFSRWDNKEMMCPFCMASNDIDHREHSWTNFRPDAWWRGNLWSHDAYLHYLHAQGLPLPPMFGPRGVIGLRLCCIMVDILHCLDQGVTGHVIGNIIWYYVIVMSCFGGANITEKIKRCQADLKRWYASNPSVRYRIRGKLTQERVRADGDWPKLKAKAAAVRHLTAYALDLALRFSQLDSLDDFVRVHDELSIGVAQLLVEFYTLIANESMQLPPAALARLPELGNQFGALYGRLSQMCFDIDVRRWKLSPKLHMFMHLCLYQCAEWGNPRFWWVYGDEDLVGIMIRIAKTVHPTTLAASVLCKWLWAVFDQPLLDPEDFDDF